MAKDCVNASDASCRVSATALFCGDLTKQASVAVYIGLPTSGRVCDKILDKLF